MASREDEDEKVCRLCRGGEDDGQLVLSCACRGSAKWIHKACLEEWQRTGSREDTDDRCGQCKDEYAAYQSPVAASVAMVLPDELSLAVQRGELQQVIKWLHNGGQVDALAENGYGLLHEAAACGRLRVAKELLQRGASIDLRGAMGGTALMAAAVEGQCAMVRLLLEHKASVDLQHDAEVTALIVAADKGHTECVQELLQAGASTELRDQDGNTALQLAKRKGHSAIANLLHQHAAVPPASAAAAPTPHLSGRRVRIGGLQARPELNGRCGVAGRFDAAKGRYEVAVEGEAEVVLLKPASLQDVGEASVVPPSAEPEPALLPLDIGRAAVRGELQQVVEWLHKGGHVDALDKNGAGLLHTAATGGYLGMAKELLQRGASVDLRGANDCTALIEAAIQGQNAMVRLLLEHKAGIDLQNADGLTTLMVAVFKSNKECVQELLQAGASTELRNQHGNTALQAAENGENKGHAAIAKLLRQHAPKPSAASVAMVLPDELSLAAQRGELQQVIKWLHKGGHVDALAENGLGLLHAAVRLRSTGGQLRVAKKLLQRGASVDLRGYVGLTAIMVAAVAGQCAMVRLLLEHKASIDLQHAAGVTALMLAADNGHTECVQELLQAGASTELRDQDGNTALQAAENKGHAAIAKLLRRQHASKPSATSPKAVVSAEARAAAEAAADRAAEELLAEEGAPETSKAGAGKKKKKKKGGGAASAAPTTAALGPRPPDVLVSAAEPVAAAPTPSACELAMAALQKAIDAGELEPIRKAINTHAAAVDGTDVLKEARTLRDRLAEQQRKAAKEAKLAGKREQKRREGEERAAVEAEAAAVAAAERADAEARAAAEEQATAEQAAAERVAAERAVTLLASPPTAAPIAPPPPPPTAWHIDTYAHRYVRQVGVVAHLLGQASLQVPAGSSDAAATAAPAAIDRPPAVTSLADAQFSTGRPEAPESTIGGQTTCIVCFTNPKSHLAAPCGHQCACGDCSARMKECPVCRTPVSTWIQVRVA